MRSKEANMTSLEPSMRAGVVDRSSCRKRRTQAGCWYYQSTLPAAEDDGKTSTYDMGVKISAAIIQKGLAPIMKALLGEKVSYNGGQAHLSIHFLFPSLYEEELCLEGMAIV